MSKIHKKTGSICLICCDEIQNNKCITIHKSRRQTHSLCNDCGTTYLSNFVKQTTNNLRNNIRDKASIVKCPGSYYGNHRNHCQKEIDISTISVPESSSLYTDIFRISYMLQHENIYMCPNKECGNLVEINRNFCTKTECSNCGYIWCRNCQRYPYHDGIGCMECDITENNTDTGKFIKEMVNEGNIKCCPGCRNFIEKSKNEDGTFQACNKIHCKCCDITWCWLCQEKNIDYDHYKFNNGKSCSGKLWKGTKIYI